MSEVVFVEDMPRYGLRMHLGVEIESLSIDPVHQPRFNPEYDEAIQTELSETGNEEGVIYIAKQKQWPRLTKKLTSLGYIAVPLGAPLHKRIIFRVRPR